MKFKRIKAFWYVLKLENLEYLKKFEWTSDVNNFAEISEHQTI